MKKVLKLAIVMGLVLTAGMLALTRYHLVFGDWRGYVIGGFALVWIANVYMSLFGRLRLEIREERLEIEDLEGDLAEEQAERASHQRAGWRR